MYAHNYICTYKYVIQDYNFTFESKLLDKLMFLLSFEFLSNCCFLALNYTGRKTRPPPLPRWWVTSVSLQSQGWSWGGRWRRVATSSHWPGRQGPTAANLLILLEAFQLNHFVGDPRGKQWSNGYVEFASILRMEASRGQIGHLSVQLPCHSIKALLMTVENGGG